MTYYTFAGFCSRLWDTTSPSNWPLWLRRLFVLTVPVSIPLWLAWSALALITVAVVMGAYMGVAIVARPLIDLWSAGHE